MLAGRCRLSIRGPLYSLCCWIIPVGVHLSHTVAALSWCAMFTNRLVKWIKPEDRTNNDALCLPAVHCINVPLIRVCVCACESSPKGTNDPGLCSYTDAAFYVPALTLTMFPFIVLIKFYVSWSWVKKKNIMYSILSVSHGQIIAVQSHSIASHDTDDHVDIP